MQTFAETDIQARLCREIRDLHEKRVTLTSLRQLVDIASNLNFYLRAITLTPDRTAWVTVIVK